LNATGVAVAGWKLLPFDAALRNEGKMQESFELRAMCVLAGISGYAVSRTAKLLQKRRMGEAIAARWPDPIQVREHNEPFDPQAAYAKWLYHTNTSLYNHLLQCSLSNLQRLFIQAPRMYSAGVRHIVHPRCLIRANGDLRRSVGEIARAYWHYHGGWDKKAIGSVSKLFRKDPTALSAPAAPASTKRENKTSPPRQTKKRRVRAAARVAGRGAPAARAA
jgi:hypothetical protein